jgi:hypothetical protein
MTAKPLPPTPGPWVLGYPGGPSGPFWSLVNQDGNVVAPQIVNEADARNMQRVPEMLDALIRVDSLLSYLRHRGEGEIPWQRIGVSLAECDEMIGLVRRLSEGRAVS